MANLNDVQTLSAEEKKDLRNAPKQYKDIKEKHNDAIILFRCGDFYETYCDDAEKCSNLLGITLTISKAGYRMAGFPYHALDSYLPRLVRAGNRIAICDQLEDPRLTKKLVKRGITEKVNLSIIKAVISTMVG